ncbi:MAG TPA: hypothetical protein VFU72_06395 [Nitrolancea sp.]|nr:hypothetical protein [Nitrolancea sp.]
MASQEQPTAEVMEQLRPHVTSVARRINVDEFTTVQFVEALHLDDPARAAYEEAVRRWPENEHLAKMILHGQVIPQLLRESGLVEWAGFAYGEEDPYAVPAWWRRLTP